MPRFHFHVTDGGRHSDDDGSELVGVDQARIEAVRLFGSLLRDKPEEFWKDRELQVEVTDNVGLILFTLNMSANVAPAMQTGRQSGSGP